MIVLDSHKGTKLDDNMKRAELSAIKSGQKDEFGVKALNVYYNDAGRAFCLTEAPSIEAVRKAHTKMGVKCDEIVAVNCLANCG
ncbi:MAG: DUF4242 domain-containing protein [Chloroflexi bacterium]|nr:DUF4242 domain-containing protein [Chloroflexota bacterium]